MNFYFNLSKTIMSIFFNVYFITPNIFLLTTTLCLLIFGVVLSTSKNFGSPVLTKTFLYLTLQVLTLSISLLIFQIPISAYFFNGFLFSNFFTYFSNLFLLFFSVGIVSLTFPYLQIQKIHLFEFWILFLLAITSVSFVLYAFDLLSIYISIEAQSLIFYILASINRTSEFSTEAGLKYFILGAFSSAFLLIGSALLYSLLGVSNLLDFSKICAGLQNFDISFMSTLLIGLTFLLTAFFFKFNIAPFHFWSPDVYDGVPLPVTATFAILPKIALAGIFLKFLFLSFFNLLPEVNYFLVLCCFTSSVVGILGAFLQTKWKRFIAYSSIGHSSFILLSLLSNDFFSIESIFFFLIIYSVMSLLFFFIVTNFCVFIFPNLIFLRTISGLKNLGVNNKLLAFYVLVLMFSLAGIPPLAGFFSKFFILVSAIKNNWTGLTIIVILLNCLASFYYLKFSKLMYFDFKSIQLVLVPMNKINAVFTSLCVISLLFLILDLDFLVALSKLSTLSLIK
uniref:NADH dehydrogenase subunit 2 n=1 Tax=Pseudoceramium inkyui TaxID=196910 RepID=UPI002E79D76B|nr:NADH dehydrogenase subunit 2 [Pseudoceramium inkyui]WQF69634.1 NADH dehydrogenase subunit 2 [Pseudoceramium inkyui]